MCSFGNSKLKGEKTKRRRRPRQAYLLIMFTVIFLVLSACQEQNKHQVDMPGWVKEWIFEKPVLKFVYEEQLLYETPIISEQDGITLTIWGTNVTPYFTDVIFSAEGSDIGVEFPATPTHTYELTTLDGEQIRSFSTSKRYLSDVNSMIQCARIQTITTETQAEQTINLALKSTGNNSGAVVTTFTVNPADFRDYYQTKKINYEKTLGEITLKTGHLHYSPAQTWIEYSVTSNKDARVSYENTYFKDIKLAASGKEVIIELDDQILDENTEMRVIAFTRPQQISENAQLVFSKGEISIDDDAIPFEGVWEVPLPSPDSGDPAKSADIEQPYSSLTEAFAALKKHSSNELYFESVIYEYRSSMAYEAGKPIYIIQVREGEISEGKSNAIVYEVAKEIVDHGATMVPISEKSLSMLKQNQSTRLEVFSDRTHEVVNLAKEQGRDLVEEAFLLGNSLKGYYNGDWFMVGFEASLPQAAYNLDTSELVVAKDSTGMNIVNGRPEQK